MGCDDEGQFTLFNHVDKTTNPASGIVQGTIPKDKRDPGAYICCYDHKDDINDVFASLNAEQTSQLCSTNKEDAAKVFANEYNFKLSKCTGYYDDVAAAGFPWWIILVL